MGTTKFHSKSYKTKVQVSLGRLSTSMDEIKCNDFGLLTTFVYVD